jgi:hypothetical protein
MKVERADAAFVDDRSIGVDNVQPSGQPPYIWSGIRHGVDHDWDGIGKPGNKILTMATRSDKDRLPVTDVLLYVGVHLPLVFRVPREYKW